MSPGMAVPGDGSPEVSVLLPVWNGENTLDKALASLHVQTFLSWECLVVDDGSEDGTAGVAEAWCRRDPRFRLLRQDHGGIVAALREGQAVARGRLLARMDADDAAMPERLARQVALMDAHPKIGLCGTGVQMTGDALGSGRLRYERWINRLDTPEQIRRELFVECPLPHPTFMMRREAYDASGGYRESGWPEDYDLCMRVVCAGWELGKVAEPLLEWRERPGRLSMTDPRYSPASFRALKRHYLFGLHPLGGRLFCQWGAGEVGKPWLREWTDPRPGAVVDINPRKIGRVIHGIPVIAPEDLPPPGDALTVVAVGSPGARDEIREWLNNKGYIELCDYLFLA
jgi:cellulose synthase/poly-beta-1,6-N-acetylglucosamine synthase-like glycosyltransferase